MFSPPPPHCPQRHAPPCLAFVRGCQGFKPRVPYLHSKRSADWAVTQHVSACTRWRWQFFLIIKLPRDTFLGLTKEVLPFFPKAYLLWGRGGSMKWVPMKVRRQLTDSGLSYHVGWETELWWSGLTPQGNLKGTSLPGFFHCSDVIFTGSFGSPSALSVPAFSCLSGHGSYVSASALRTHLSSPLRHFLHGPGGLICWFPPALPESPQSEGILSHLVLSGCPSASELLLRLLFLISNIIIITYSSTPPESGNAFIPYLIPS